MLEIERVAAARAVDRSHVAADELRRLGLVERGEDQTGHAVLARRCGERGDDRLGQLSLTGRHCQQDGAGGRPVHERGQRVERAGIRPVEVVEPEHQRARGGEPLEQVAEGAVQAVAVGAAVRTAERGQDRRQRGRVFDPQPCAAAVVELSQVRGERLGPDRVRQIVLELRRRGAEHQGVRRRPLGQLGKQPRLADPRLSLDGDHQAAGPGREPRERIVQRLALSCAADQHGRRFSRIREPPDARRSAGLQTSAQ